MSVYNLENLKKLQDGVSAAEGMSVSIRRGITEAEEFARGCGSKLLAASSVKVQEAGENIAKMADEYVAVNQVMVDKFQKLNTAANG